MPTTRSIAMDNDDDDEARSAEGFIDKQSQGRSCSSHVACHCRANALSAVCAPASEASEQATTAAAVAKAGQRGGARPEHDASRQIGACGQDGAGLEADR